MGNWDSSKKIIILVIFFFPFLYKIPDSKGSKFLDEKGNVIMERENEKIEKIAEVFIPVEIRSVSKAKIGEKEIKMTTRMRYENVKVNEKIKEKEFEVR